MKKLLWELHYFEQRLLGKKSLQSNFKLFLDFYAQKWCLFYGLCHFTSLSISAFSSIKEKENKYWLTSLSWDNIKLVSRQYPEAFHSYPSWTGICWFSWGGNRHYRYPGSLHMLILPIEWDWLYASNTNNTEYEESCSL